MPTTGEAWRLLRELGNFGVSRTGRKRGPEAAAPPCVVGGTWVECAKVFRMLVAPSAA